MPIANFVRSTGEQVSVEVPIGVSLMRAAIDNGEDQIVADCGGFAACGTCHVYVDEAFVSACPPVSSNEDEMLGMVAAPRTSQSRLSCQLLMSEALAGVRVTIADPQL